MTDVLSGVSSGGGAPSAQTDRFVHDRLPPRDQWPDLRYDRPELQIPDAANLVATLLGGAHARGWGERPLLRSPTRTLSYAQAEAEVNRIARVLTGELGLVPGNRVLLRGGNSVAMALAWLAVVKAGLVAVATMPLLRARELGDIIDKAQPTLALCDGKLLDELRTAQASTRCWPPSCRSTRMASRVRWRRARPGSPPTSPPAPPPPTTSRCWPSPPAPPANPRRWCTPTATCWRPARPGPAMCCAPHPTTS
jgi:non-ribosomal peptide synthetase component F